MKKYFAFLILFRENNPNNVLSYSYFSFILYSSYFLNFLTNKNNFVIRKIKIIVRLIRDKEKNT